jgi:hypothetical protein
VNESPDTSALHLARLYSVSSNLHRDREHNHPPRFGNNSNRDITSSTSTSTIITLYLIKTLSPLISPPSLT